MRSLYVEGGYTDLHSLAIETGVPKRTLSLWRKSNKWDEARERRQDNLDTAYHQSRIALCRLMDSLVEEFDINDVFKNRKSIEWLVQQLRFMSNINESLMKQAPLHSAKVVKEALAITKEFIQQSDDYTQEQKDLVCEVLLTIQAELISHVISTVEKLV